jgi:CheW-like domain
MTLEAKRGGIVLADGERAFFVHAANAQKLVPMPEVSRVPGAHEDLVGIAQVDGVVLPVVSIGASRRAMLVVEYAGEPIGIVGADVLATGAFEAAGDGSSVRHDGRIAKPLDLAGLYARLQAGSWAGRADSRRGAS